MKKAAKKEIQKLEKAIRKLPNTLNSFVYVDLCREIQQLFFQKNYGLVCVLSKNIRHSIEPEE